MAGGAAGSGVMDIVGPDEDVTRTGDLGEPGVADVHDVVHPGLDGQRRFVVRRDWQDPRAENVVGMVRVDLEVVGSPCERPADVLRVTLALPVMDDLHRVFAGEIERRPSALVIDRVDPEVGRDVAVKEIKLEVDKDRFSTLDLEPEPVEAAFSLLCVGKIIRVVGRAIDVAAELQRVGLLPSIVGLGLDGYALRFGERELSPLNANRERGATRIIASDQRDRDPAVRGRAKGQVPIRIARVHFLPDRLDAGPGQLGRDTVPRAGRGLLETQQQAERLARLEVAQQARSRLAWLERETRGSGRRIRRFASRGDCPRVQTEQPRDQLWPIGWTQGHRDVSEAWLRNHRRDRSISINLARPGRQSPVRGRFRPRRERSAGSKPSDACCSQCK